jgi:hypothetical protein
VSAEIVRPSLRWGAVRIIRTNRLSVTDEQLHDVSEHEA